MVVGIQDELLRLHSMGLLSLLLADKTQRSRKTANASRSANILWATDAYQALGPAYGRDREMEASLITGEHSDVIKNRARKAMEQQSERVRKHGEVFTPRWVCRKMVSCGDAMWFGKGDPFLQDDQSAETVVFPKEKKWTRYVDERRLEITCGEAPYLVQRYDVETGEVLSLRDRQGMLDRKLRVVSEETTQEAEWLQWAFRAFEATYGYEFQGDNVLIARMNLLMTFEDYLKAQWRRTPTRKEYERLCKIITWNLWQMDGLTGRIPYCHRDGYEPMNLFHTFDEPLQEEINFQPRCRIYDWRRGNSLEYGNVNTGGRAMKFDFIIGNPPYQDQMEDTSDNPIYNCFMNEAYKIADKVELITPARFLFNAGKTPKDWNKKMLNDTHLKVLFYEQNSSKVFPGTDIKGGIAITYRNINKNFGSMQTFTIYSEVNSILKKVVAGQNTFLDQYVYAPESYKFTKKMYEDHPDILKMKISVKGKEIPLISNGHQYDLTSNILEKLYDIVFFLHPKSEKQSIRIMGRKDGKRVSLYVDQSYVKDHPNLDKYKVFFPKANGSGKFGESMSESIIGEKQVGHTQTFISIGAFNTRREAENLQKYLKCKFTRTLLYVLKVTQDNKKSVWKYVPLQDFTSSSDIDWSKSVADIDQQLYKKYGLTEKEIQFIETHVKEMK